jgi:hypothetical protein
VQRNSIFSIHTYSVILLGCLGAIVGLGIILFGSPTTPESRALISSPEFVTWVFINDVLFALYPILLALLWPRLRQRAGQLRQHRRELLASALVLLLLYIFPMAIAAPVTQIQPPSFEYSRYKIFIIEAAGFFLSALPLSLAIWLIQIEARQVHRRVQPTQQDLLDYAAWSRDLQHYFMIYAVLLSLFIFATAAMRKLALATGSVTEENYPFILLLLFGAYYSLLIALIYLPAYATLLAAGDHLLNTFFPLPSPGGEAWQRVYVKRKELEDFLELKVSPEQRLATMITLLAPLVSGFLSYLVDK